MHGGHLVLKPHLALHMWSVSTIHDPAHHLLSSTTNRAFIQALPQIRTRAIRPTKASPLWQPAACVRTHMQCPVTASVDTSCRQTRRLHEAAAADAAGSAPLQAAASACGEPRTSSATSRQPLARSAASGLSSRASAAPSALRSSCGPACTKWYRRRQARTDRA